MAIAAGGNHSLALRTDGTVVRGAKISIRKASYAGQSVVPSDLGDAAAIGAGDYHSLAVKLNGAVAAWGDDLQGQIDAPGAVGAVTALTGGSGHTVALKANGFASAWGNNSERPMQCSHCGFERDRGRRGKRAFFALAREFLRATR